MFISVINLLAGKMQSCIFIIVLGDLERRGGAIQIPLEYLHVQCHSVKLTFKLVTYLTSKFKINHAYSTSNVQLVHYTWVFCVSFL